MISDSTLEEIATNLEKLRLSPALHLKIAVAIIGQLMAQDSPASGETSRGQEIAPTARKLASGPRRPARRARKAKPEPIAISYAGQTFLSRCQCAEHLATIIDRSATTLVKALKDHGEDAQAVVRRYRPAAPELHGAVTFQRGRNQGFSESDLDPPPRRPSAPSPEARARVWLEGRLQSGPVDVSDFEDAISRHVFDARSAEQAKIKLGIVARRIANGHGATVHLCLAAQAAALDAQGGTHG